MTAAFIRRQSAPDDDDLYPADLLERVKALGASKRHRRPPPGTPTTPPQALHTLPSFCARSVDLVAIETAHPADVDDGNHGRLPARPVEDGPASLG